MARSHDGRCKCLGRSRRLLDSGSTDEDTRDEMTREKRILRKQTSEKSKREKYRVKYGVLESYVVLDSKGRRQPHPPTAHVLFPVPFGTILSDLLEKQADKVLGHHILRPCISPQKKLYPTREEEENLRQGANETNKIRS